MKTFDDAEFRELLTCYAVPEPPDKLITQTKARVFEELAQPVTAPACREAWIFVLAGLAVVMSLCLFYMFTVGTILQFLVPAWMALYLKHSLLVFTAVGTSVIAGAVMTLVFKYFLRPPEAEGLGCSHFSMSHLST